MLKGLLCFLGSHAWVRKMIVPGQTLKRCCWCPKSEVVRISRQGHVFRKTVTRASADKLAAMVDLHWATFHQFLGEAEGSPKTKHLRLVK